MSLDVLAYEYAILVSDPEHYASDCEENDHITGEVVSGHPLTGRGVEDGRCYEVKGRDYCFNAGSYQDYGIWRNQLCLRALGFPIEDLWDDPEHWQASPFFELLYFDHTSGTIGWQACEALSKDFNEFARTLGDLAPEPLDFGLGHDGEERFQIYYLRFRKAFELSANAGMVYFC